MNWYRSKWWRLALSSSRVGIMWDEAGRWVHVVGPLWILTERGVEYDAGPFVCPGCFAVDEPCYPGCIGEELRRKRESDSDDWMSGPPTSEEQALMDDADEEEGAPW